jgi:hypothetical protein
VDHADASLFSAPVFGRAGAIMMTAEIAVKKRQARDGVSTLAISQEGLHT